jgi:hypothetical protein
MPRTVPEDGGVVGGGVVGGGVVGGGVVGVGVVGGGVLGGVAGGVVGGFVTPPVQAVPLRVKAAGIALAPVHAPLKRKAVDPPVAMDPRPRDDRITEVGDGHARAEAALPLAGHGVGHPASGGGVGVRRVGHGGRRGGHHCRGGEQDRASSRAHRVSFARMRADRSARVAAVRAPGGIRLR